MTIKQNKRMKKTFYLFLIILFSINSFSQSTDNLDIKNGFKQFKLGTKPENYSKIKISNPSYKNTVVYDYVGNDITELYSVPIKRITLHSYKDQLMQITIWFSDKETEYTEENYETIQNYLIANFGSLFTNSEGFLKCSNWKGKKVKLQHARNFLENYQSQGLNPYHGYISIMDEELFKKKLSDQF